MKTAAIPAVRVPPELRQAAEELLADGETLSGFVEDAVRRNVAYRRAQAGFVARGLTLRDAARASGRYVKAATVLGKLKRRLKGAQKKAANAK